MKKIIVTILTIGALGITLGACNKEDINKRAENNQIADAQVQSSECPSLDFNVLDLGETHNQTILNLIDGVDLSDPEAAKDEIIQKFRQIELNFEDLQTTPDEYYDFVINVTENLSEYGYDIRNWTDAPIHNSSAYPYIEEIVNKIEEHESLSMLNQELDIIEANAKLDLTCADLDIVLGTIKITRSSAYLWTSEEDGGYGLMEQIMDATGESAALQRRGMREAIVGAIKGDASASASYFIGGGIAYAAGWAVPGANVAILGGWAVSAGLGSLGGALGF